MLSLPPAFNLSHDQTLQFNLCFTTLAHLWYVVPLLAIYDTLKKVSAHRVNELTLSIFAIKRMNQRYHK